MQPTQRRRPPPSRPHTRHFTVTWQVDYQTIEVVRRQAGHHSWLHTPACSCLKLRRSHFGSQSPTMRTICPLVFPVWTQRYTLDAWPLERVSRGVRGQTVYLMRGGDCRGGSTSQTDRRREKRKATWIKFSGLFSNIFYSYFIFLVGAHLTNIGNTNIQLGDAPQTASVNTSEPVDLRHCAFWLILDACLEKYDQVHSLAMCIRLVCNYVRLWNEKRRYRVWGLKKRKNNNAAKYARWRKSVWNGRREETRLPHWALGLYLQLFHCENYTFVNNKHQPKNVFCLFI